METIEKLSTPRRKNCPLSLIADKWTVLVINQLEERPRRFSEIHRNIEGVSQKMLTQTLRDLERSGVIQRQVFAEVPPRVEYSLTPLGESLREPLSGIRLWATTHMKEIASAQEKYDAGKELALY
jgi:DNA-binding HxlR family transcriptional regulator